MMQQYTNFPKSRSHLEILSTRRVTWKSSTWGTHKY